MRSLSTSRRAAIAAGIAAVAVLMAPPAGADPQPGPLAPPRPVAELDVQRYLGTWRQLAAVPQIFNLSCARDTTAEYALTERGDIAVRNSCVTWTGELNQIQGTATVNDPRTRAQLHVSFPGAPGQDQPSGPTNYIVTALGPDYSWALVTDPTRLSGFVLARAPHLDPATWDDVRAAITAVGQSPCVYLTSPTTGGIGDIAPLCTR
ncbi:lipocalin family protein [Nocardia cyriacigeorgica]|jgi:apolipoprotein D and lipocalin family protein|uniref:lipocalin family protein n=1 Tax=Nocardia cyriacigeorgica TaxID=135487 RepID=UPI000CEB69B0|nr:lipocalin family protein [Nocardia cyriacigeorgica]AVH24646.1 lipocalin [Nocardia cyriacigeorgica]MBF6289238.1 lipocalin family protein [Nocardia cyriacigeorgica]MBF6326877.1 lipocalin family protein [Nocardia cyriacigeorgica]MBF6427050.1 lipocalin family protein [Nocardia cyriacigeorgica]